MSCRLMTIGAMFIVCLLCLEGAMSDPVSFEVAGQEPDAKAYQTCRRMIVGPDVNQPESYEGYGGFVGWPAVTRLRSGQWLMAFSSGCWHASVPWTEEIKKDPASRKQFEEWQKLGLPDLRSPRGGRAHIMRSDDEGLTWTQPQVLVDTEDDDRRPTILELADGTFLCTFSTYRLPRVHDARYMLSRDAGETWTDPMDLPGKPEQTAFSGGPAIQLSDGTVVWVAEGKLDPQSGAHCIGVYRSTDSCQTFELASVVKTDHSLYEPTIAETSPGKLTMAIRREGDICFSEDGGLTWEQSGSTIWNLYDPHLLQMPNGVLALFHGSYTKGGVRVFLSPDGGRTWRGPGEKDGKPYGYSVDPSVYGYSHPMLLPDGTAYVVYLKTGGHRLEDAQTEALYALRVRVFDDADGIEILPAPGSPATKGKDAATDKPQPGDGGDAELGNEF